MAISLKHTFTSPKADGVDSTLVQPSNWNAEHTITLAAGKVLGRNTSGAGAAQELPLAFDTAGNAALSATGSFTTAVGTTAERPGTPVTGMFRFNSSLTKFEGYNGTAWSPVGGGGATISDTAPANPTAGDLWWNSANGQMYTYYNDGTSSQWVVANSFTGGSAYLPLTGGTLTGAVSFFSGSAAAPSITTSGDTNTGIFFPAADTIAFAEGGTEVMRIDSSGLVGIGTNAPASAKLVVSGNSVGNSNIRLINTAVGGRTWDICPFAVGVSDAVFAIRDGTAGADRLNIGSSGQIGIGGANYGTSGQVLTSNGAAAAPSWQTVSGGVTSLTAGNGITVSASTGAVTVSQDIYTGSTANNTSYPIGTCILLGSTNGGFVAASSQTVRLADNNASNLGFIIGTTSNPVLTGTWRIRGQSGDFGAGSGSYLLQRTA